jgi:hypothetical protein
VILRAEVRGNGGGRRVLLKDESGANLIADC